MGVQYIRVEDEVVHSKSVAPRRATSFYPVLCLLADALAIVAGAELDAISLRRAETRVPRSHFRGGPSYAAMTAVLNRHLSHTGPSFSECDLWTHAELTRVLHTLLPLRSNELQSLYELRGDPRDVRAFEQRWEADAQLLETEANVDLVRDAACHDIALLWVHHLSAASRTQAKSIVPQLPFLPSHEPSSSAATPNARARHASAVNCAACHSTVDPPPQPDGPAQMPTNFNATMTMYDPETGYYVRRWDYRWDNGAGAGENATHQMYYRSLHTADVRSANCSILFDQDHSVWEWYEDVRRCAKVMEFSAMMCARPPTARVLLGHACRGVTHPSHVHRTPGWARHAAMVNDYGRQTYVHPLTNQTQRCHRFCAANFSTLHIGCYCQAEAAPHFPMKHTHETPNASDGGVTYYTDVVETPELRRPLAKPAYCPPQNTAAVYPSNHIGLEKICLRCWLDQRTGDPC